MWCSISVSRIYDTSAWTRPISSHCNISRILPPTLYFLSHRDYTAHIVSQVVIGHHLFTIIVDTLDHYWHSSHIAFTYSSLYALLLLLNYYRCYIIAYPICYTHTASMNKRHAALRPQLHCLVKHHCPGNHSTVRRCAPSPIIPTASHPYVSRGIHTTPAIHYESRHSSTHICFYYHHTPIVNHCSQRWDTSTPDSADPCYHPSQVIPYSLVSYHECAATIWSDHLPTKYSTQTYPTLNYRHNQSSVAILNLHS